MTSASHRKHSPHKIVLYSYLQEFANLRRSTDEVHSCLQRRLAAASASVAKFAGNMNAEAAAMKTADAADDCDPSTGDSPMDSS